MLGFKGPRKMTVVIPGMLNESKRKEFRPESENDGIIGMHVNLSHWFAFFMIIHITTNIICYACRTVEIS